MYEVDPGHHLEELAGNMDRCSGTAGCHIDPARIGLGVGDELGDCPRRNRGADLHDEGDADDGSDGRDIAKEIEAEIFIKRRIDRIARRDLQERVSVRRRSQSGLGADIARSASAVLDDELAAETLREPLCHHARNDVGGAPGGKADDDAHRPRRIGLRPSEAGHGRQRGSARCQMQKLSAGKFQI